eukprot:1144133-Pyramimonas_sp.AAC.1
MASSYFLWPLVLTRCSHSPPGSARLMRRRALGKRGLTSMQVLMDLRISSAQSTKYLFVGAAFEWRTAS